VKKANLSLDKELSMDTIITNLKAAYKDYSNLKAKPLISVTLFWND